MKKILEFLKRWIEHNGLIKILVTLLLLAASIIIGNKFPSTEKVMSVIAAIIFIYLLVFTIALTINGIWNTIKGIKKID